MFDIDFREVNELADKFANTAEIKKRTENAFYNSLNVISEHAKKNHKFKSRSFLLENSITQRVKGLFGEVFVPLDRVPYAEWIYDGSGLFGKHKTEIVPVNAGALSFKIAGEQFFAKSVKGIHGEPFIENSYKSQKGKFTKEFESELSEELEEFFV